MTEENPYAPPTTIESSPQPEGSSRYYVSGKLLMIRDGAVLPNRCIKTNLPVEPGRNGVRKKIGLSWCNPAWFLLLLVNILIMLIVVLCVSKKAKIEVAISSQCRNKKIVWRSIWSVVFFGGVGMFVYGIVEDVPGALGLAFVCAITGLIGLAVTLRYLSAKSHRDGLFSVKGCHPDFLAELKKDEEPTPLADLLNTPKI